MRADGRNIYLDNAATTKPYPSVINKFQEINEVNYGNPSSANTMGITIEREIKRSTEKLAALVNINPDELLFTSGGTESNNLAIIGACMANVNNGRQIITTKMEHASVRQSLKFLGNYGFKIIYLENDKKGYINTEHLRNSVTENTVMVTVMHVNNEFGTVNDLTNINSIIKSKNKNTLFHSDGIQGFGKIPFNMQNTDLYTFSAHKIHGLKGTGALYAKKGTKIKPLMYGGGQQGDLRPGTENTGGIAAFAAAADECFGQMNENYQYVYSLKKMLLDCLSNIQYLRVNGDAENGSPYILNLCFDGVKANLLMQMLGEDGIFISTGAACSSRKSINSPLTALGLNENQIQSAIRISFSSLNTAEEIEYCSGRIKHHVNSIRRLGKFTASKGNKK